MAVGVQSGLIPTTGSCEDFMLGVSKPLQAYPYLSLSLSNLDWLA